MNGNKPIHKVSCGSISVAIWLNEIETGSGTRTIERVTAERRYKDKDGTWKSANHYSVNDLARLILALQKAQEYLLLKSHRKDEAENEEDGSA